MKLRSLGLAAATALVTLAGAGAAAANVPNGNGLEHVIGELVCGSDTTLDVLVTPGGGATGWRVDQGGHHVLSYFSITYHLDFGDVTESKTWGMKSGIAPLVCEPQFYPGIPELGVPAVTIEATIHPLPGP